MLLINYTIYCTIKSEVKCFHLITYIRVINYTYVGEIFDHIYHYKYTLSVKMSYYILIVYIDQNSFILCILLITFYNLSIYIVYNIYILLNLDLPHFSPVNSTDSLRPYYLGSTFITEGSSSDVTIEYILHEPRPPVDNVTWIFDNQIISSDDLEYVMTNRSIQIRNVNRNDSGVYQVTASNAVGEGNIGSMLIVRCEIYT